MWEEASENRARALGSRGWGRFGRQICLCGKNAVAEWWVTGPWGCDRSPQSLCDWSLLSEGCSGGNAHRKAAFDSLRGPGGCTLSVLQMSSKCQGRRREMLSALGRTAAILLQSDKAGPGSTVIPVLMANYP